MPRKPAPASLENLKKRNVFQKGNKECYKGAAASHASVRRKKSMREALEFLLQLPWSDPTNAPVKDINNLAEALQGANLTVQDKILVAQIVSAVKGNTQAAVYIRDTAGQTILPDKAGGPMTEYEDDGFMEAVKSSATEVWGERRGNKKKTANKASCKVRTVQSETDADLDVVDGKVPISEA